jgi:hypothetical protein
MFEDPICHFLMFARKRHLPLIVLFVMSAVPKLKNPPPFHAVLSAIEVLSTVIVPLLQIPPPAIAALSVMELSLSVSTPVL